MQHLRGRLIGRRDASGRWCPPARQLRRMIPPPLPLPPAPGSPRAAGEDHARLKNRGYACLQPCAGGERSRRPRRRAGSRRPGAGKPVPSPPGRSGSGRPLRQRQAPAPAASVTPKRIRALCGATETRLKIAPWTENSSTRNRTVKPTAKPRKKTRTRAKGAPMTESPRTQGRRALRASSVQKSRGSAGAALRPPSPACRTYSSTNSASSARSVPSRRPAPTAPVPAPAARSAGHQRVDHRPAAKVLADSQLQPAQTHTCRLLRDKARPQPAVEGMTAGRPDAVVRLPGSLVRIRTGDPPGRSALRRLPAAGAGRRAVATIAVRLRMRDHPGKLFLGGVVQDPHLAAEDFDQPVQGTGAHAGDVLQRHLVNVRRPGRSGAAGRAVGHLLQAVCHPRHDPVAAAAGAAALGQQRDVPVARLAEGAVVLAQAGIEAVVGHDPPLLAP